MSHSTLSRHAEMGEQQENIERVGKKIGAAIVSFWLQRMASGRTDFHMDDLLKHVRAALPPNTVAPDSASRILRDLRSKGRVNYVVLERANSLYRCLACAPDVGESEPDEPPPKPTKKQINGALDALRSCVYAYPEDAPERQELIAVGRWLRHLAEQSKAPTKEKSSREP